MPVGGRNQLSTIFWGYGARSVRGEQGEFSQPCVGKGLPDIARHVI